MGALSVTAAKKVEMWDQLTGVVVPLGGTPGRKIEKLGMDETRRIRKGNCQWAGSKKGWKYKSTPANPWGLTRREAEILTWLIELEARRDVMEQLKSGECAYDAHLSSARKKLNAKTSMGAVLRWAYWLWTEEEGQALREEILGLT
jgi:DNA-binding CsgD family transcriptional regulator